MKIMNKLTLRYLQQNENPRFRIDIFYCFYNPFFCFLLLDVLFLLKETGCKKGLISRFIE